tara:strand:- start:166 stop:1608 length:1443 start_codon:yes stop_codon:yes gene_type:complete
MTFVVGVLRGQEVHTYTLKLSPNSSLRELTNKSFKMEKSCNFLSAKNSFFSTFVRVTTSDETLLDSLVQSGTLLYWEKDRAQQLHFTPSDPAISQQWYLDKIKVKPVWEFAQGDTNFVVGVVDSGVDYTHEDLQNNLAYNYKDPINGVDDDADGYIDNFYGWDFGSDDMDPIIDGSYAHGSAICGIVAASTNNAIGTASSGYKCKYLPVKITNTAGVVTHTNIGIAYAAQMGVQVINCSFGSEEFSQSEADIITYVTDSMNVLVIASAGNNNSNKAIYPAALENVIGVCAVDQADQKTPISNYGSHYQIAAPGEAIFTTYVQNDYTYTSGTSVAAAVVSSAAILLRSYYPNESVGQIKNRLLKTADAIHSQNSIYQDSLGSGRLNLQAAFQYNRKSVPEMTFIPNPTEGEFYIDFNLIESGNYQISVYDVLGKLYYRTDFFAQANASELKLNLDYLKQGYYAIQLRGNGMNTSSGIVIVK